MHSVEYCIRTLAPVLLTDEGEDANLTKTRDYFTGSIIRGILADKYIRDKQLQEAHTDETFCRWFLQGGLTFHPAYPAVMTEGKLKSFAPIPLSIQYNKQKTVIVDLAIADDAPEGAKPYRTYGRIEGNIIYTYGPKKTIIFHTRREDRLLGHSGKGDVFNYEALQEGQWFWGRILGAKTDLDQLKSLWDQGFEVFTGRSRSTQYGRIRLDLGPVKPVAAPGLADDLGGMEEVILVCHSPVILANSFGFPTLGEAELAAALRKILAPAESNVKKCFLRTENIESFRGVWQMKTPQVRAVSPGSTLVLNFPGGIDEDTAGKLEQLGRTGLGERRNEGFGLIQFVIPDPERITYLEGRENRMPAPRPGGKPPALIQSIFEAVTRKTIHNYVERQAYDAVKRFYKPRQKEKTIHLSNSLIGRLELILRDSPDPAAFRHKVGSLREAAQEQLKAVKDDQKTLLEFLYASAPPYGNTIFYEKRIEELLAITGWNPNNPALADELFRVYWQAFFRIMRKQNKQEEVAGNEK